MSLHENEAQTESVKRWVEEMVVGYNLCPFAKKPLLSNGIRFVLCSENKTKNVLHTLGDELAFLDEHAEVETTLVILGNGFKDFYQYLKLVDDAQQVLDELDFQGIYQLASFHPEYLFEGEDIDDASHFTNRAPLPILHIIRESSIEKVLKTYKDPDSIPHNNIQLMRSLGTEVLQAQLDKLSS